MASSLKTFSSQVKFGAYIMGGGLRLDFPNAFDRVSHKHLLVYIKSAELFYSDSAAIWRIYRWWFNFVKNLLRLSLQEKFHKFLQPWPLVCHHFHERNFCEYKGQ